MESGIRRATAEGYYCCSGRHFYAIYDGDERLTQKMASHCCASRNFFQYVEECEGHSKNKPESVATATPGQFDCLELA